MSYANNLSVKKFIAVIIITFLVVFYCFSCNSQQGKTMDNFEFSLKTAHPDAKNLMTEDFFWSPIEETGPFGSDDSWDAAYGFRRWRMSNKSANPLVYLKELIASWQYPFFDWYEMDTQKIKAYIFSKATIDEATIQQQMQQMKEALKNTSDTAIQKIDDEQLRQVIISTSGTIGGIYLLGQDNAIIGTGFAQFALEGKISSELKNLTITALKRQLLPVLVNRYDPGYIETRKYQLTKMLEVINKVPVN